MATNADPYALLGVSYSATASEVRLAFRKAALRYHPDLFEGEQAAAEAAFRRLVDAYHRVLKDLSERQGRQAPPLTPRELAQLDLQPSRWEFESAGGSRALLRRRLPPGTRVRSVPTLDETAVFVAVWIGAILLAAAITPMLASGLESSIGHGGAVAAVLTPLVLYTLVLLGGLGALMLTRRIVYLVLRIRQQRLLPGPIRLSQQGLWRMLTDRFRQG